MTALRSLPEALRHPVLACHIFVANGPDALQRGVYRNCGSSCCGPQRMLMLRFSKFTSLPWHDFRLLVESVVDYAIYLLDPEGRVATWNAGAEKINGYRASDIVGEHVSTFYPSEDLATQKPQRVLRCASTFGQVSEEGWRVRKDGSRFWASDVITALRDGKGGLLGFASVTRNLTNSLRAEDELRRSEERFRLLIENVSDYAIYMLDTDGRV